MDEANAVGLNGKEEAGVGGGESIQDKVDIISGSPAYCNIGSEAEMRHVILDVDRRGLQLWSRSFKAN